MTTALIFAGGSGIRMNTNAKPKQFLQLYGKEIIVHTIEHFEKHAGVDAVAVACLEAWIPYLQELVAKFGLGKVRWVVAGGETGQASTHRGLAAIRSGCPDDTTVLVHDGVRPLITQALISDCIAAVAAHGAAIAVTPAVETVVALNGEGMITAATDRSKTFHARAPQCFRLGDIWQCYERAAADGLTSAVDSASLMMHYGHQLHAVPCAYDNIKITTPSDFYVFRALYEAKENLQILGL
ncbi:MAG: 2-C-methyl-D-erythritol 4-phosphate cytidylyltransferase [Prevotellaceae bacterium]|jgi:2-C-methyl-D-erythritol 4-phosphate cytidylyltransferase|nr:2-C-methyl-D-erythritol 4-phosphate cytidylyltransferase [Prevotellaceae bacterium]